MAKAHFVPLLIELPLHRDTGGIAGLDPDRAQRQSPRSQMPVDFSGNGYLATDAAAVIDAFETALEKWAVDRRDPEALVVAKHIITFAKAGERDPERLRDLTVKAVRNECAGPKIPAGSPAQTRQRHSERQSGSISTESTLRKRRDVEIDPGKQCD